MGQINLGQFNLALERQLGLRDINANGVLPTGHEPGGFFWDLMRSRYLGHEARFTHYHPVIAPWLKLDDLHRHHVPIVCPPPPLPPPPECHHHGDGGGNGSVPEPKSGLLLLLGLAMILCYCTWRLHRSMETP